MQRSPASMTDHLDESTTIGTRAIAGSEATRFRKRVIAASESSRASSMLTSMAWAPPSTCARAISRARVEVAVDDPAGEGTRAGHVRALADVEEEAALADVQGLEAGQPQGLRPRGNGPRRGVRVRLPRTAATWAGPVPQQPPTTLTIPASANPRMTAAMASGVSS